MKAQVFVNKWANTVLNETQVAHAHFLDVCRLVGVEMPGGDGLTAEGDIFIFEQPVKKGSGRGRADVYYEGRFAVEYKTPDKYKDLQAAFEQLTKYKDDLSNPPLLIVTDINHWEIHTNFVNTQNRPYVFHHDEIASSSEVRGWLHDMFFAPERLHPRSHTERVTQDAAKAFESIADNLRQWDAEPTQIAYFLTKLVFCMFAEDVRLLPTAADDNPDGIFTHIVKQSRSKPSIFKQYLQNLFATMNIGGELLMREIRYFNGTLFIYTNVEVLSAEALDALVSAVKLNWKAIEPSVFGTLFERSLDPAKRAQLGAHYTSREDILLIVEPVLMQPLRYEWDTIQLEAEPLRKQYDNAKSGQARMTTVDKLLEMRERILDRIRRITVLDPACGSGNFLYVALQLLMDLEKEVIEHDLWSGLQRATPEVHPRQMYGIEINPIAHALASIVVWIGYIQWRTNNAYTDTIRDPILEKLQGNIVCKDAILAFDDLKNPTEPDWPPVDVIVGNPPFLGDKRMRGEMGDDYVDGLRAFYEGRVPGGADLVTYWFEKARGEIQAGKVSRVGLLATNSIRIGTNRSVLSRIKTSGDIFMAWSDREWSLDGANVRVSMIAFDDGSENEKVLDGGRVSHINSDLTATVDIVDANSLNENENLAFLGVLKTGPFEISERVAASMRQSDIRNRDVVKPRLNGRDIVGGNSETWIIDFLDRTENEACRYKAPYEYLRKVVKPVRDRNRVKNLREKWWQHARPRYAMRAATTTLARFIATPEVTKHRIFVWIEKDTVPDHTLHVVAREDDYFLGVLHSSIHVLWAVRMGSTLGPAPRYNSSRTFKTFPFPWSPGAEDESHPAHAAISAAAKQLHEERHAWLNPATSPHPPAPSPKMREGELGTGEPATGDESPLPLYGGGGLGVGAKALKDRTLTNLYNALQVWRKQDSIKTKPAAADFAPRLDELHRALDEAVCDAYGWEYGVLDDEEEILRRLLALNLERAG